jgi:hypothetical protein
VGSWAYEYYCFLSKIRGRRKEFLNEGRNKKGTPPPPKTTTPTTTTP